MSKGLKGLFWSSVVAGWIAAGGFLFHGAQSGREAMREIGRQEAVIRRMDQNVTKIMWYLKIPPAAAVESAEHEHAPEANP